jgi:hypothetical protein
MARTQGRASDAVSGVSGRTPLVLDRHSLGAVLERGPRALPSSIPIRIEDPALTPDERDHWEAMLTELYNACGCHEGALGLAAAIPVIAGTWLLGPPALGISDAWGLALVPVLLFLGAALGKLVGIGIARLRLHAAVARLEELFRERAGEVRHGH